VCPRRASAGHAVRDGYIGLKDFRGKVIDAHIAAGWIYHGEAAIDKNPQAQAIRTKAKGLTFSQLERDAAWMRPALADFLLLFRKDGESAKPVKPDVTRDEWIEYADRAGMASAKQTPFRWLKPARIRTSATFAPSNSA